MVTSFREAPLACVWSSYPGSHPGWRRWSQQSGPDALFRVYMFWSARWWVALSLLRQGLNVLSLDVDAALLSDVYALLHAEPLASQDVIITKNTDQSGSLNCGFVYFNRGAARRGSDESVRHACNSTSKSAVATRAQQTVPAAVWMAEQIWLRFVTFLELDRSSTRSLPNREVLWEQDVWNDVVKSTELRRRVFPWAVAYGKK
eukprot:631924-Prymnesium_polylepis.2